MNRWNVPQQPKHRRVIGIAAVVALVLLSVFYSIVSGAVDKAATQRRAAIQLEAAARAAADARFASPALAVQVQQQRLPQRYAPRAVAYRTAN